MEFMGLNDIREKYLSFFESKGHIRLESAPLVPRDDASLLLINSGMAPLKKYFLGLEAPPRKRAVSCQKCIRTNDIENVGRTSRHCSFFEMLGNFSFGDYFKEEATEWALEFFTKELKIPVEKLYMSVYQDDDEAYEIWTERLGIDPSHMVRLGKEDNFWEHGPGPCGPSSELYFDYGADRGCGKPNCAPGCDCDRFVEIWNLVFTQFNSDGEGNYTPLSSPNIDTGMSLERLACVIQDVNSVFEVDVNRKIMNHIAEIAGVKYGENEKSDFSLKVITDHMRATVFMVGDGVIPQNEGRGYVLRRLLRRAARHGRLLGIKVEFLYKVCDTVIGENKAAYPYLAENADYIKKVIQVEEERFSRTVEQGMEMLSSLMDELSKKQIENACSIIPGEDVFKLYDTFGFPLDLTMEIASDMGFKVDEDGFLKFMHQQRERARKAREDQGAVAWEEDVTAGMDWNDKFVGYTELSATTKVLQIVKDNQSVNEVREGETAVVFLAETPFYSESGGQVGDKGIINVGKSIFKVKDCRRSPTGHIMHIGLVLSGFVAVGDDASVFVDKRRRRAIMRNHTAAHLLQAALRNVLGEHVHQAGSMVSDTVCRFDFTHFNGVTPEQLADVETRVNDMIMRACPVVCTEMPLDEAKKLGAIALFGDKYGDIVRVCNVANTSVELCGGTHVSNTSQLGLFKITSESSIAAGVRRIEAVTGRGVLALIAEQEKTLGALGTLFKVSGSAELETKAAAMAAQLKAMQKELDALNKNLSDNRLSSLTANMEQIGSVKLVRGAIEGGTGEALKSSADSLKDKEPGIVGVFVFRQDDKCSLFAFAGREAVKAGIHCGKLVKDISAIAGGSGGGRPDNAMGGLANVSKIDDCVAAAGDFVKAQLGI